jgi:tetratricopeptide (TPR) repeat protein
MEHSTIRLFLEDLKSEDESTRDRATRELWSHWFNQKGTFGFHLLEQSQICLEAGEFQKARTILDDLVTNQPDFAEAWNRRAILHYVYEHYEQSLADCRQVVALNPIHFGAWHGMGLCHIALGEYACAIRAFRHALEIQPHAVANQRLLLECSMQLSDLSEM